MFNKQTNKQTNRYSERLTDLFIKCNLQELANCIVDILYSYVTKAVIRLSTN